MAKIQDIVADSILFEEGALRLEGDVASADLGDKDNHFYGIVDGVRGFHEVINGGGDTLPPAPTQLFVGSAELITGTVTDIVGTTLTGVGTQFLSEIAAGDHLAVADAESGVRSSGGYTVVSVTSNTEVEVVSRGEELLNDEYYPLLIKVSSAPPLPGGDGSMFNGFSSLEEAFTSYAFDDVEESYNITVLYAEEFSEIKITDVSDYVSFSVALCAWLPDCAVRVGGCRPREFMFTCANSNVAFNISESENVDISSENDGEIPTVELSNSRNIIINCPVDSMDVYGDCSVYVGTVANASGLQPAHLIGYTAAADSVDEFTDEGDRMVLTGMTFFHTALGKPVWFSGADWVDATGAVIVES